jgi:hypothetical protein
MFRKAVGPIAVITSTSAHWRARSDGPYQPVSIQSWKFLNDWGTRCNKIGMNQRRLKATLRALAIVAGLFGALSLCMGVGFFVFSGLWQER